MNLMINLRQLGAIAVLFTTLILWSESDAGQLAIAPIDLPVALVNVHPRLYAKTTQLDEIKALCQTTPPYKEFYQRFMKQADHIRPPTEKIIWDRDYGNKLWDLTAAWRFSGDPAFLAKAKAWAIVIKDCPDSYFQDFFSGHLLCGMALFYDWCYADLSAAERETVRTFLVRGTRLTKAYLDKTKVRYLLSNQWQIRIAGIGLSALALDDHPGESSAWVDWAVREMGEMENATADDGVTVEGVGYGQYGVDFTMRFLDLTKDLLGINFYRSPWWSNNALFQLYQTTPRASWKSRTRFTNRPDTSWLNVDIGDCPRYNWYGPDYLLRGIAKETGNSYAQWLADVEDAGNYQAGNSWLNLIRYDARVKAKEPSDLPTLHHFENTGIVSARSDWSGRESLISFICGPYYGHKAVDHYDFDLGGGHAHPNANAFAIFGAGEWLVAYPGYERRMGVYENTLIVDGKGQLGQDIKLGYWNAMPLLTNHLHPRILKVESNPAFDYIIGDATPSYDGLTKWQRHLLFIKPNTLLVLDEIAAPQEHDYKLLFHCEATPSKGLPQKQGAWLVKGDKALLLVQALTTEQVQAIGGAALIKARHGDGTMEKFCVMLQKHTDNWRSATAFNWTDGSVPPVPVHLDRHGNSWSFSVGTAIWVFDWSANTLRKI